jgi:hypothetical protein
LNRAKGKERIIELCIEALAYLSMFEETKTLLAFSEKERFLSDILRLSNLKNRSVSFGLIQIICNMCTSVEDIQKDFDNEIERLKQIASKGLNVNKEREVVKTRAGDAETIAAVRQKLLEDGAVSAMVAAYKDISKNEISLSAKTAIARTLRLMATEPQGQSISRGRLVQQGAVRILLDLFRTDNEKCKEDCSIALARIGITTNPLMYSPGTIEDMISPLAYLVDNATNELYQFEALMALTNLASSGEEICTCMFKKGVWYTATMAMTCNNPHVQRSALEVQANMIACPEVIERLISDAGDTDLRIFLAFAKSEEEPSVLASTGALAMCSYYPEIAKKIDAMGTEAVMLELLKSGHQGYIARVKVILDNIRKARTC